ncbi:cupredoxin domain-containing protein [Candidatus Woesearchaeota archaeon]|nr:MAG: cytochrome c oxidase subunit II [archaeon GW2011_AR4]MBS3129036.1 cupredoxin domain-containing protein [Candidatus Woesearchaeota archaeon]HIH37770.1 hypothetical protein [Candidatus Woesearchaeota archaeon]HIH49547.1 hypothetical protein [Candidatus Woesearchaeota archaeon]HIJ03895.1 hypothetical protein [Candidatus Woesearchaeota archaeon]
MNTKLMGIVLVAFLFVMGCSSTKNADVGVAGQDMMVPAPENANVQETIVSDTQIEDGSVDGQPAKPPVEMIRQEGTLSGSDAPVKELRITAYNFGFDVEPITINKGDTVKVIVTSREGTHGFALPDFGISIKPVSPGEEKTAEFVADKAGEFTYFCNVPCGAGHQSMRGNIVVT